jgi:hypothetical protein
MKKKVKNGMELVGGDDNRFPNYLISLLLFSVFLFTACGSSPSTSTQTVICGPGTYLNGNACSADRFTALINPANTYWSCGATPTNYVEGFIFVSTTATSGTGTYAPKCGSPLESFTWEEAPGSTDSISLTLTTPVKITSINPSNINTTFSADGMPNNPAVCTLISGAMPLTSIICPF